MRRYRRRVVRIPPSVLLLAAILVLIIVTKGIVILLLLPVLIGWGGMKLYRLSQRRQILTRTPCPACGGILESHRFINGSYICPRIPDPVGSLRSRQNIPADVKRAVTIRDRNCCRQCGASGLDTRLEFDHVIPFSRGGDESVSNIQLLCFDCNRRKGNRVYSR